MRNILQTLCEWARSLVTGDCRHAERMAPRFDYDSGKFLERCLGCGQRVRSDFTMDTRQYYALRPKAAPVDTESQDVAALLDRSRRPRSVK